MKLAAAVIYVIMALCSGVTQAHLLRGTEQDQQVNLETTQARMATVVVADTLVTYNVAVGATKPRTPNISVSTCLKNTTKLMLNQWIGTGVDGKLVVKLNPTFSVVAGVSFAKQKCNYFCLVQGLKMCQRCKDSRSLGTNTTSTSDVPALANLMKLKLPKTCPELVGTTVRVTKTVTPL